MPAARRASDQVLVGTMPRDVAVRLLGEIAPSALDWIEDDGAGGRRCLPVIYAANRGVRTTTIEYEVPD